MPILVPWIGDGEKEVRDGMVQAKMVIFRNIIFQIIIVDTCVQFNSTVFIADK